MRTHGGFLPGLMVALATLLSLFALTGYQATTATAGTRFLGRIAASVVEVDRWLPAHQADIQLLARDKPQSQLHMDDLPVPIVVPSVLILNSDAASLRRVIVESMGRELYNEGNSAYKNDAGVGSAPGYAQPVYWSVALLDKNTHDFWRLLLPVALLLLIGSLAMTLRSGRQIASPVVIGAFFGAVACFAAWIGFEAAANALASPVNREVVLVLRDGAFLGLRDSLAVGVVATVVFVVMRSLAGERTYERKAVRSSSPPDWPVA